MPYTDQPNPERYRWFFVSGTLAAGELRIPVILSVHADDLAPGDAGRAELAERIRQRYGDQLDRDEFGTPAHWAELSITEHDPPEYHPTLGIEPEQEACDAPGHDALDITTRDEQAAGWRSFMCSRCDRRWSIRAPLRIP